MGDGDAGDVDGFGAGEEKVRGVFGWSGSCGQSTAETFDPQPAPIAVLPSEREQALGDRWQEILFGFRPAARSSKPVREWVHGGFPGNGDGR